LVRTEASALNSLDLWVGRGLPGLETQYPFSSGSDGAGRVEEVGAGVDRAWIGRRILLNAAVIQDAPAHPDRFASGEDIRMIGEHSPGTMGEFFCAPAKNVLDIGDTDPIQAAAFGLTHLTAWRMLMSRAQLRAGMTILVTGIGGGVAVALLNIAKHFGCTVIVTSRHQWKLDRARELGAAHGILDDGSDWSKTVRALTGKRGVDIVADSIGKAVHSQCIKSLVRGGVFVTCGATTGGEATTDLARMFWNQLTFMGSTMGDMDEFRAVTTFLRSGEMLPIVDSIQKPQFAKKAYERLESGEQFGKVLIDWA
jgi:NADPH:quinone reductase-like Zn-dependent oxidoreductase